MAVKKCKDCGGQVSTNAKACPQCGAVVKKGVGILGWLFVIFIVLPIAWSIGKGMDRASSTPTVSSAAGTAPTPPATPPKPKWIYSEYKDDMTGKPVKLARLESINGAHFEFPYEVKGGSKLTLYVRNSERGGSDVYMVIQKGQITCHISKCNFNIRVGDGQIKTVSGLPATSGNSDTAFFKNPAEMKNIFMTGKPFKLEVGFYSSAPQTFNFESSEPLVW